jgi:hypothetical protein
MHDNTLIAKYGQLIVVERITNDDEWIVGYVRHLTIGRFMD